MSKKPLPEQSELYWRCDEVLHYMWDPVGVAGAPRARDEYRSYLPDIQYALIDGKSATQLADLLSRIEEQNMGMKANHQRASMVANVLCEWRDWI